MQLEQSMLAALEGQPNALEQFYRSFLACDLYVPRRYQAQPLSDAPNYPNQFIDLLGLRIKGSDQAIIPVFSSPELILSWCGNELAYQIIKGQELLARVPEGWSLVVNPGMEVEKEIDSWELDRLREGESGFPELLAEVGQHHQTRHLQLAPIPETEYVELQQLLKELAQNSPSIAELFFLKEESAAEAQTSATAAQDTMLVIGVVTDPQTDRDQLRQSISTRIAPLLIGDRATKILIEPLGSEALTMGLFRSAKPLFTRSKAESSFLSKLLKAIAKKPA